MSGKKTRTSPPAAGGKTLSMRPIRAVTAVRLVLRSLGDDWTVDRILDYFSPEERNKVRSVLPTVLGSHHVILFRPIPDDTHDSGFRDPKEVCVVESWEAIAEPCGCARRIRALGKAHVGPIDQAWPEAMADAEREAPELKFWKAVVLLPGDPLAGDGAHEFHC